MFNHCKLIHPVTPNEFKTDLMSHGLTVRDWARANGFSEMLVYAVLSGKNKASRGESFKIAIALGLKMQPANAPEFIQKVISFKDSSQGRKVRALEGRAIK